MSNSSTLLTSIVTSLLTSGITTIVIQEIWHSKIRRNTDNRQEKYEICDNFRTYVESCQAVGGGFWSVSRAEVPADTVSKVLFLQERTEGAFHPLEDIGYTNKDQIIELFDLLTGGDYDEQDRLPQPDRANEIAILAANICTEVDAFKRKKGY